MSQEQALAEAEAFIRRTATRLGSQADESAIKAAAEKVVRALPPVQKSAA